MSDETRGRSKLKQLFTAGKIPSEKDFSTLIDSQLNGHDDKLQRLKRPGAGDSLCIGAGSNGTLMSFLDNMQQAGGAWTLRLTPKNRNLEFRLDNAPEPLLFLGQNQKVGIGTDQPGATLEINGDLKVEDIEVSATVQTRDLAVDGTLVFKKLIWNGTELDNLDQLFSLAPPPPSDPDGPSDKEGKDGKGKTSGKSTDDLKDKLKNTLLDPLHSSTHSKDPDTAKDDNSDAGTPVPQPAPVVVGDAVKGKVAADGQWHSIASSGMAFQAVEVLASVREKDNMSILMAHAVNAQGDSSSGAIQSALSYQGATGAKLKLRWAKSSTGTYELQLAVGKGSLFSNTTQIQYQIRNLLPTSFENNP